MTTEATPSARRPLKSRGLAIFQRIATGAARAGVTPNAISFASILFGCAAGVALAATANSDGAALRGWWIVAAVCIQLRLLANMLDGMVAVEGGKGGPTGELWNEAPDRLSDAATLIGAGYAAGSIPVLGWAAAVAALMVAYVRALGASVGAGQIFVGPQAKPHRMAVLTVACLVSAVYPVHYTVHGWRPIPLIQLALVIVIVGGGYTAIRRLRIVARHLETKPRG